MTLAGDPEFSKTQFCHSTSVSPPAHSFTRLSVRPAGRLWLEAERSEPSWAPGSWRRPSEQLMMVRVCGDERMVTARWRTMLVRDKFLALH